MYWRRPKKDWYAMASYSLTSEAHREIAEITEYSLLNFGRDTAREYISGLHEKLSVLADNQTWGTDYGSIIEGLRRYEYRSHSIYYMPEGPGILIVRILGKRQDPMRHF